MYLRYFHNTIILEIRCPTLQHEEKIKFISKQNASNSSNVIAILLGDNYKKLAERLSLLDQSLSNEYQSDIMIFHTSYPYSSDISSIINSTKRRVIFHNVDREFSSFPLRFDPYSTDPTWSKRGKWNYHHMIRFWFKLIFEIPEIQHYEYIMRLDDDSKLLGTWMNVFRIMRERNAVYFANSKSSDSENGLPGTMKLKDICLNYLKTIKMNTSSNIETKLEGAFSQNSVTTYYNNFEIVNIQFFRQPGVRHWIEMIDETHGIYKYRWGDAILRYILLIIFAEPNQILHREAFNLQYCHPC